MVKFSESLISDMLNGKGNISATLGKGKYNPELLEKIEDPELQDEVAGKSLTLTEQWLTNHGRDHENPSKKKKLITSQFGERILISFRQCGENQTRFRRLQNSCTVLTLPSTH